MTATPAGSLRNLPAFQGLSDAGMARLESNARVLRYELGQTISERSTLPAQVLVLLNGQGRLLAVEGGTMVTVGRLQPGQSLAWHRCYAAIPARTSTQFANSTHWQP